jgi:hypothetical protein
VTFRYRDSHTGQPQLCTLEVDEFIHRFLQHILPQGFVKVRYYGLLSPGCRPLLALIRQRLSPPEVEPVAATPAPSETEPSSVPPPATPLPVSEAAPPPAESDIPSAESAGLPEEEDEPDTSDALTPPPPSYAVPRCPACGRPMRRRASVPPLGRSPP